MTLTLTIEGSKTEEKLFTDAIICKGIEDFENNLWKINKEISLNGFTLLQAWDDTETTLQQICSYFGELQYHIRANEAGFVNIKPASASNNGAVIDQKQYIGTSLEKFMPHTDGSYLNGIIRDGENVVRVTPPKMILLQCIHPSTQGGQNQMVDAQEILRDLLINDPFHARILLRDGALTFCRDDQIAIDFPMFQKIKKGIYQVRFRFDAMTYAQNWSYLSVLHLQNNYFSNPKYIKKIDLQKDQILIIDNIRMLHGRDAVDNIPENQKRFLRRAWIKNEERSLLANVVGEKMRHRAFEACMPYRKVSHNYSKLWVEELRLGIKLPPELQTTCDRLSHE